MICLARKPTGEVFGLDFQRQNDCGKHKTSYFVDFAKHCKDDIVDIEAAFAYLESWKHCDVCHPELGKQ